MANGKGTMARWFGIALAALTVCGWSVVASADPAAQSVGQAAFGLRVIQALAADKPDQPNVVVSPAGLASVLAAIDLGADPAMHSAIATTLGIPAAALGEIRTGSAKLAHAAADAPLQFAGALFVDKGVKLLAAISPKLAATGVTVHVADLGDQSGVTAANQWVAQQTAGLIPSILDQPPGPGTMVALNALHFKDAWRTGFDEHGTTQRPFQLVGGSSPPVSMMHTHHSLAFRIDDKYVAVALPYKTPGYELVVVCALGPPQPASAYADVATWLASADFTVGEVDLSLPSFHADLEASLLPDLDRLGLAAGHSDTAFNGFSLQAFDVADVRQNTVIKVDEKGTEAASASSATMAPVSVPFNPPPPKLIVIDKPFLFALREVNTGFVLLSGYIGNPAAP